MHINRLRWTYLHRLWTLFCFQMVEYNFQKKKKSGTNINGSCHSWQATRTIHKTRFHLRRLRKRGLWSPRTSKDTASDLGCSYRTTPKSDRKERVNDMYSNAHKHIYFVFYLPMKGEWIWNPWLIMNQLKRAKYIILFAFTKCLKPNSEYLWFHETCQLLHQKHSLYQSQYFGIRSLIGACDCGKCCLVLCIRRSVSGFWVRLKKSQFKAMVHKKFIWLSQFLVSFSQFPVIQSKSFNTAV